MQAELQSVTDKFFATRAELDMLQLQLNPSVGGAAGEEGATPGGGGGGRGAASNELLRTYLGRIADLEKEVRGGGAGGGGGGWGRGWREGTSPTWWRRGLPMVITSGITPPSAALLRLPALLLPHPPFPQSPAYSPFSP